MDRMVIRYDDIGEITAITGGHPWETDEAFKKWFAKYGKDWDSLDDQGMSGGYRLYRAFKLGLAPDPISGHLYDADPKTGEPLKTYEDPNKITRGIDNGTGYQVAPATYTGPMTSEIMRNAHRYYNAGTARRVFGPGGWEQKGVKPGTVLPALRPPAGYQIPPDPALRSMKKMGY